MASDTIWIVTSERVENNFSGDVAEAVAKYARDMFGSDYDVNKHYGYSIDGNDLNSMYDVQLWWEDDTFTSSNKNLLLTSEPYWGFGGYGLQGTHACTLAIRDGITKIVDPSKDSDLIGDEPKANFSPPQQVAGAIQEIAHLYGVNHKDGYADNHNYVNYTSPMLATYADNYAGEKTNCGITIQHKDLNETRYVQGFMQCAVTAGDFPSDPARIYTHSDVDSF